MPPYDITRRSALAATTGLAALTGGGRANAKAKPEKFESLTAIPGGARLVQGPRTVDILFSDETAISVVKYPVNTDGDTNGLFIRSDKLTKSVTINGNILRCGDLEVRIDMKAGRLSFARGGKVVMSDEGTTADTRFGLAKASDLYGLGQFRDAMTNYRDRSVYVAHGNMDAVNPVLVSPDGWGLLWDSGTDSHFTSQGKSLRWTNPSAVTRYHVFPGQGIDDVIAAFRRLTGKAPLLPKYAYGFWQSQERYNSQKELTDILDGYRSRKLPVDVMVQDWNYWGNDRVFSGMVWDKTGFPDPKGMCDHVHKQNARIIASVWPALGPDSAVYKALDAEGLLFNNPHWSGGKVLDITAPKAQDIYWSHIKSGLMDQGLDGLWTDGAEPEFMSTGSRYVTMQSYVSNGNSFAGPLKDNALTFSYYQARLLYSRTREDRPEARPLILTRSVYAGQQAFNAVTWSGDTFAGWETFNYQITAALQISLSGIPYWTNDIGAFLVTHRYPEGLDNPAYRELYVRWFQQGAFLPVFRAHGTQIRRHLWAMGGDGDPHYEALKQALHLRYALMPYIYAQAASVTEHDETFLRPLVMDYGQDVRVSDYPSQYLFGRDILVCPVNTPLLQSQETYEFIPNYAVIGHDAPAAQVDFFEGADFDRKVDTRRSDDLKMSWFGDLPPTLKGKAYSAVWKGRIVAQDTGLHRFQVIAQGLIRLTLNGEVKVASQGRDGGEATGATGAVSFAGHAGDDVYRFEMNLKKGQAYDFELTQSQPKPDVVSLWVEWITPSQAKAMQTGPDKAFPVYLPSGNDWYRFGKAGVLNGGQTLQLRPALNEMPLFVRAGAIIPMTPGLQYATETPQAHELHIYGGADGAFTLYDDSGDGYGTGRRWALGWRDQDRTLTFAAATGDYQINAAVTFKVTLYEANGSQRHATVMANPATASSHTV